MQWSGEFRKLKAESVAVFPKDRRHVFSIRAASAGTHLCGLKDTGFSRPSWQMRTLSTASGMEAIMPWTTGSFVVFFNIGSHKPTGAQMMRIVMRRRRRGGPLPANGERPDEAGGRRATLGEAH